MDNPDRKAEYNTASMHNLALGILASVTNSTQAPTRREKLEVAQVAAALALVDVVNGLRADLADWRDTYPQALVQDLLVRASLPVPPDGETQ